MVVEYMEKDDCVHVQVIEDPECFRLHVITLTVELEPRQIKVCCEVLTHSYRLVAV